MKLGEFSNISISNNKITSIDPAKSTNQFPFSLEIKLDSRRREEPHNDLVQKRHFLSYFPYCTIITI